MLEFRRLRLIREIISAQFPIGQEGQVHTAVVKVSYRVERPGIEVKQIIFAGGLLEQPLDPEYAVILYPGEQRTSQFKQSILAALASYRDFTQAGDTVFNRWLDDVGIGASWQYPSTGKFCDGGCRYGRR